MKRFAVSSLLVLAALSTAVPALAQAPAQAQAQASDPSSAAARLPNTFDGPAARVAPAPTSPAQTPPPEAPVVSDPAVVAAAEAMLRKTIAAMQAGSPNYGDMSENLAEKVREQSSAITPLIQSFGPVQDLAHVGHENGAELFLVLFANQNTRWIIAQNPEGRTVVLLFQPAPSDG